MSYEFQGQQLPRDLEDSLTRYVNDGCPTGDFLRACLGNDLMEAAARADDRNIWLLPVIASYIWNVVPRVAHGSYLAVDAWIKRKRLEKEARDKCSS